MVLRSGQSESSGKSMPLCSANAAWEAHVSVLIPATRAPSASSSPLAVWKPFSSTVQPPVKAST